MSPNSETLVLYKYDAQGENFAFECQIKAALDNFPGSDNSSHLSSASKLHNKTLSDNATLRESRSNTKGLANTNQFQ